MVLRLRGDGGGCGGSSGTARSSAITGIRLATKQ